MPDATGSLLFQPDRCASRSIGLGGQRPRRAQHQVVVTARNVNGKRTIHGKAEIVGRRYLDQVACVGEHHQGVQQVVAVGAGGQRRAGKD